MVKVEKVISSVNIPKWIVVEARRQTMNLSGLVSQLLTDYFTEKQQRLEQEKALAERFFEKWGVAGEATRGTEWTRADKLPRGGENEANRSNLDTGRQ